MSSVVESFKKFGVPISEKMDIKSFAQVWESTDSSVKEGNAEITAGVQAALVQFNLVSTLTKAYSILKKQKINLSKVIENASAVQQGQIQYPILTVQEETAKIALTESGKTFDQLKEEILT